METVEKRRKERLESLSKLLDAVYDDQQPTETQPADIVPNEREKRERVIMLTMFGL